MIYQKRPHSEYKLVEITSNTLYKLYEELGQSYSQVYLSNGFLILRDKYGDSTVDELNIVVNVDGKNIPIFGTFFLLKVGKEKILDMNQHDLNQFKELFISSVED